MIKSYCPHYQPLYTLNTYQRPNNNFVRVQNKSQVNEHSNKYITRDFVLSHHAIFLIATHTQSCFFLSLFSDGEVQHDGRELGLQFNDRDTLNCSKCKCTSRKTLRSPAFSLFRQKWTSPSERADGALFARKQQQTQSHAGHPN
jgi:hypothetical protein